MSVPSDRANFVSTRNPCKLCTPFGACMALRGFEGAMPVLHGSQGCATYIRRYLIGHFREPMDVASTNFSEKSTIFGGRDDLHTALANVIRQYDPQLVGVATTCLAETIGDDVTMFLHEFAAENVAADLPPVVGVSTPSYAGSHEDGFHAAVRAVVAKLAESADRTQPTRVNVCTGMVSPADVRNLADVLERFGLEATLLPDISETMDGPTWAEYQKMPPGGTPLAKVRAAGAAAVTLELSDTVRDANSTGKLLAERFGVPNRRLGLPIGVGRTDALLAELSELAGRPVPEPIAAQRGRLIDAYFDAHKYLFGQRVVLYGEEDLVVALAGWCAEVGLVPALCATGGNTGRFAPALRELLGSAGEEAVLLDNTDFAEIDEAAAEVEPDLIIGNSNGMKLARKLSIPLVRVGLPIHDRLGAARVEHILYRGTQSLLDRVTNALIQVRQESSPVGYTHM